MKLENQVVMIADGTEDIRGDKYFIDSIVLPEKEVPLTLNFLDKNKIGSAVLKKEGDRVLADMEVTDSEIIKAIESGDKTLRVGWGIYATIPDSLELENTPAQEIKIFGVTLFSGEPVDGRIPVVTAPHILEYSI